MRSPALVVPPSLTRSVSKLRHLSSQPLRFIAWPSLFSRTSFARMYACARAFTCAFACVDVCVCVDVCACLCFICSALLCRPSSCTSSTASPHSIFALKTVSGLQPPLTRPTRASACHFSPFSCYACVLSVCCLWDVCVQLLSTFSPPPHLECYVLCLQSCCRRGQRR